MDELSLCLAAANGDVRLVESLIKAGADVDAPPLMRACLERHVPVVKLLLRNGADPMLRHKTGQTALDMAGDHEQIDTARHGSSLAQVALEKSVPPKRHDDKDKRPRDRERDRNRKERPTNSWDPNQEDGKLLVPSSSGHERVIVRSSSARQNRNTASKGEEKEKERERDSRDRGRDKEREKERPRDKDKDREKEKEKERDRDRDRDRDRNREKDRDRDLERDREKDHYRDRRKGTSEAVPHRRNKDDRSKEERPKDERRARGGSARDRGLDPLMAAGEQEASLAGRRITPMLVMTPPPELLRIRSGELEDENYREPIGRSNSARGSHEKDQSRNEKNDRPRSARPRATTTEDEDNPLSGSPRLTRAPRALLGSKAPSSPAVAGARRLSASASGASNTSYFNAQIGSSSNNPIDSPTNRSPSPSRDDLRSKDDIVLVVPSPRQRSKSHESSTQIPIYEMRTPSPTPALGSLSSPSLSEPSSLAELPKEREGKEVIAERRRSERGSRGQPNLDKARALLTNQQSSLQQNQPVARAPQPQMPPMVMDGDHLRTDGMMVEMDQKMSDDEKLWKQQVMRTLRSRTISVILSGPQLRAMGIPSVQGLTEDPRKIMQRTLVVNEIVTTENNYKRDLQIISEARSPPPPIALPPAPPAQQERRSSITTTNDQCWRARLQESGMVAEADITRIFGNVDDLLVLSEEVCKALDGIEQLPSAQQNVAGRFTRFIEYLRLYIHYCANHNLALARVKELKQQNPKLENLMTEIQALPDCKNLDLKSFLIKPLQRVTKYPLLFKEIAKNTSESHADFEQLRICLERLRGIMEEIDDSTKKIEAKNVMLLLQERFIYNPEDPNFSLLVPDRMFLLEERFERVDIDKGPTYRPCQLFLFNDMLLFAATKKHRKSKSEAKFNKVLSFNLRQIFVLEEDKGFQVISTLNDKTKVTITTSFFDQKARWVEKINAMAKELYRKDLCGDDDSRKEEL